MTIQLYILRRLVTATLATLLGLGVVILPTLALHAFFLLGAAGLGPVLSYLPLTFADVVPYVFPMAFLIALVATYGRLAAERELMAMRLTGMHPVRLCLPAVALALVGVLATAHHLRNLAPRWRVEQRTFRFQAEALELESLFPGRTELEFGDGSLVALERIGNRFLDVLVLLPGEQGPLTLLADAAVLSVRGDRLQIEFEGAHILGEHASVFDEFPVWSCRLSDLFTTSSSVPVRPKYFRSQELRTALADGTALPHRRSEYLFEIHHRNALSLVYVVFLLIGIPIGLRSRGGSLVAGYLRATALAFAYFAMAMQLGRSLVRAEAFPPVGAAWLTDVLFLGLGGVLFHRTIFR